MTPPSRYPAPAASIWSGTDRRGDLLRLVLLALAGTGLLWASAKVQVPFYPVPMTLQTAVVLLIGIAYGPRLGSATMLLYLAEGAVGLPVFAGTPERGIGLAYMMGPTGGYLVSYVLAAALVGWVAARTRAPLAVLGALFAAMALIYLLGAGWLALAIGVGPALSAGVLPFLLGDAVKLLLVLAVATAVSAERTEPAPEPLPVRAPDPAAFREAAALLEHGRLVAFPTETVYGLGALATDDEAVRAIFTAKNRPAFNPLIVHVADLRAAAALAVLDDRAQVLAATFWPGPLSLVLVQSRDSPISPVATAGLGTVALRVPRHPVAQALLQAVAAPVAAPSANPSGLVSPTEAGHVATDLGQAVDLVLDGGPCPIGVESTVVDLSAARPALLRPGGLPRAAIEAVIGPLAAPAPDGAVRAPGQLLRHYAPRTPLRLDAREALPGEVILGFGPEGRADALNLSFAGDLEEAARNLFAMLRRLDALGAAGIAVAPIPAHGLGEAIRDRLRRAAAG